MWTLRDIEKMDIQGPVEGLTYDPSSVGSAEVLTVAAHVAFGCHLGVQMQEPHQEAFRP